MTNLEKFEFFLSDLESPDNYIRWNYYFMISSCLERRVWIGDRKLYPNLYIIFVAKPGFGKSMPAKSAESIVRSLVTVVDGQETPIINVAPDTVSFEKLLIILANDKMIKVVPFEDDPKKIYIHTSVSFCLGDEIGTLLRDHTTDVVTILTKGWDCQSHKVDTVKHGEKIVTNMCLNLLGCCTPSWVGRQLDNNNLHEGFSGRVLFIYGEKPRKRTTMFRITEEQLMAVNDVRKHLTALTKLKPRQDGIIFNPVDTPEAFEWFDDWVQNRMDVRLNDSHHLDHYYGRKKPHLMKLAMLIHFSESLDMKMRLSDFEKALEELEILEMTMDKAMSASAKNPLYLLSEQIKQSLAVNGPMSYKRLLVELWSGGNEEDIVKAVTFLRNTGQVQAFNENNVQKYKLHDRLKDEKEKPSELIEHVEKLTI